MKLLNKILLPLASVAVISPVAVSMVSCAKSTDENKFNEKAKQFSQKFQDATSKYTKDQIKISGISHFGEDVKKIDNVNPDEITYNDKTETLNRSCTISCEQIKEIFPDSRGRVSINFLWNDDIIAYYKTTYKDYKVTWWVSGGNLHYEIEGTLWQTGEDPIKCKESAIILSTGYYKERKYSYNNSKQEWDYSLTFSY